MDEPSSPLQDHNVQVCSLFQGTYTQLLFFYDVIIMQVRGRFIWLMIIILRVCSTQQLPRECKWEICAVH